MGRVPIRIRSSRLSIDLIDSEAYERRWRGDVHISGLARSKLSHTVEVPISLRLLESAEVVASDNALYRIPRPGPESSRSGVAVRVIDRQPFGGGGVVEGLVGGDQRHRGETGGLVAAG